MATKKYVSIEKLGLYDEKIKQYLADADEAALATAKGYADSLAKNYDAAGAAATVQGKLDEEITRAKAKEDEIAAANAATQKEVDDLEAYVGTLPAGSTATSVVDYVNLKTTGIATDTALGELTNQVTGLQGVVNGITADYLKAADKKELSDAIKAEEDRAKGVESGLETRVKAIEDDYLTSDDAATLQGAIDGVAEDVAEIAEDYLKAADKTELEGKIGAKADQTALDAEVQRATGVEGGFETRIKAIEDDYLKAADKEELQGNIDDVNEALAILTDGIDAEKVDGVKDLIKYVEDHGTEVTGMKEDIAANTKAISDHEALAAETYETKTDAEGKLTEAKAYTDTAKAAVVGTSEDASTANTVYGAKKYAEEKATAAKEAAEATAAGALDSAKSELEGKINAKADASVVADMDAAYKAADTELSGRIAAVEAQLGDGEGSVADLIDDAKTELRGELETAIAGAKEDASNKDAVVLAEAQKGITAVQTALDTHTNNGDIHVTAEQKTAWTTAAGKAHEHSNLTALEGITAEKIATWDKVSDKAEQTALQAEIERATAAEKALGERIDEFVECSQEDINKLFTTTA